MKNTIFFNDTFTPILLENEETDSGELQNEIYLRFRTSSSQNQRLHITVRYAEYDEQLEPSTDYNFMLAGEYWAAGGVTLIQLLNDDFLSQNTQITFPDIISTDAALLEDSEFVNAYYMQGKEEKDEELRQQVIVYTNGREYNIQPSGSDMQKIAELVFSAALRGTNALLVITVIFTASDIEDTGDVEMHFRVNRVFDEMYIPIQTVRNGKYVITVNYPIMNIAQGDRNQVDVFLMTSAGNIRIEQGRCKATITASSISVSEAFTGDLEVLELLAPADLAENAITIVPIQETYNVAPNSNIATFTEADEIPTILIFTPALQLETPVEGVIVGRRTVQLSVTVDNAAFYTIPQYVNVGNSIGLRTDYTYVGTAGAIDSGFLTSVDIPLDELTTVTEVTVQ